MVRDRANQPDDRFEEDQQGFDEHGRMDNIQSFDVLLIPESTGKTTEHVVYRRKEEVLEVTDRVA